MTAQQHEAQRYLVLLSLRLCPDNGHPEKGHDAPSPESPDHGH